MTIPHKGWAAKVADKRDDLTLCCGAANTLLRVGEELHAFNTDGPGALRALRKEMGDLTGRRFLIVGYGGSATAIAHALLLEESPAMVLLTGRNKGKGRRLAEVLEGRHEDRATLVGFAEEKDLEPDDVDVVIQTTSLGMSGGPEGRPLPEGFLHRRHTAMDIVYNPLNTPFLREARSRRARVIPGYRMLLEQAVLQFELFTGLDAPKPQMERELLRALSAPNRRAARAKA